MYGCDRNIFLMHEILPVCSGCLLDALFILLPRMTPLDLALLAGHSECSDYLIARGGKSAGGQVYRAVVTIQMAWRFYLHKVHGWQIVNSFIVFIQVVIYRGKLSFSSIEQEEFSLKFYP